MNAVTLTNAARWNLAKAKHVQTRGTKSEAQRLNNKREAERLRANAQRCKQRLKELS